MRQTLPVLLLAGISAVACAESADVAPSAQDGVVESPPEPDTATSAPDAGSPTSTIPLRSSTSTTEPPPSGDIGEEGDGGTTTPTTAVVTSTTTTAPIADAESGAVTVPEALNPHVEVAVGDLADRLAIAAGDVTVRMAETIVWPDSSLGCPQPGKAYTQVRTEGYRIVLGAQGRTFHYHGGGGAPPFYCAIPSYP